MKFFQLTTRDMPKGTALGIVLMTVEEARAVDLEFVDESDVPTKAIRALVESVRQSVGD